MKILPRSKVKEGYVHFLKCLQLDDIYLSQTTATFDRERFKSFPKEIPIQGQSRCTKPILSGTAFTVRATMEVLIGGSNAKESLGRVEVTYALKFSVRAKELNPEHVNQFTRSTIKIVIWPFFREFIHSMTARFGIPHVNVPIHTE
jgi:preprotein translocase subunit SecB